MPLPATQTAIHLITQDPLNLALTLKQHAFLNAEELQNRPSPTWPHDCFIISKHRATGARHAQFNL